MAAITATDWTESIEDRVIEGKHKRNRVKLTLGSNGGFYPSSGGIPLPTTMGMVRNIDYVVVVQPLLATTVDAGPANANMWAYDVANHSVHGYQQPATSAAVATGFAELPTTWAVSLAYADSPVMYVEAVGW